MECSLTKNCWSSQQQKILCHLSNTRWSLKSGFIYACSWVAIAVQWAESCSTLVSQSNSPTTQPGYNPSMYEIFSTTMAWLRHKKLGKFNQGFDGKTSTWRILYASRSMPISVTVILFCLQYSVISKLYVLHAGAFHSYLNQTSYL